MSPTPRRRWRRSPHLRGRWPGAGWVATSSPASTGPCCARRGGAAARSGRVRCERRSPPPTPPPARHRTPRVGSAGTGRSLRWRRGGCRSRPGRGARLGGTPPGRRCRPAPIAPADDRTHPPSPTGSPAPGRCPPPARPRRRQEGPASRPPPRLGGPAAAVARCGPRDPRRRGTGTGGVGGVVELHGGSKDDDRLVEGGAHVPGQDETPRCRWRATAGYWSHNSCRAGSSFVVV